ncbi:MAG: hypothetical protein R2726_00680 [Acidimicrobiales bacterium]
MSYESSAEPIKLGYLFDFVLPEGFPKEMRDATTLPFEIVFEMGLEQGIIDRPVEIVFREVEGLPKGSVKAVNECLRRVGRRGLPGRVRTVDHRQLRADQGGHRRALPRPPSA